MVIEAEWAVQTLEHWKGAVWKQIDLVVVKVSMRDRLDFEVAHLRRQVAEAPSLGISR